MRGEERGGERKCPRGHAVGHVESRANWRARAFPTFAHGPWTMLLARCAPRVYSPRVRGVIIATSPRSADCALCRHGRFRRAH
eukprot:1286417-Prymnesium_polylepis.1